MMINALTTKLSIGLLAIVVGGGGAALVYQDRSSPFGSSSTVVAIVAPEAVHTADWYVGHPSILKQDEGRCAGDAATISQAACQNVDSADNELGVDEMEKAAAQDSLSGPSKKPAN
jgi:hypothetical protein